MSTTLTSISGCPCKVCSVQTLSSLQTSRVPIKGSRPQVSDHFISIHKYYFSCLETWHCFCNVPSAFQKRDRGLGADPGCAKYDEMARRHCLVMYFTPFFLCFVLFAWSYILNQTLKIWLHSCITSNLPLMFLLNIVFQWIGVQRPLLNWILLGCIEKCEFPAKQCSASIFWSVCICLQVKLQDST